MIEGAFSRTKGRLASIEGRSARIKGRWIQIEGSSGQDQGGVWAGLRGCLAMIEEPFARIEGHRMRGASGQFVDNCTDTTGHYCNRHRFKDTF